jgi:hypothetical protein
LGSALSRRCHTSAALVGQARTSRHRWRQTAGGRPVRQWWPVEVGSKFDKHHFTIDRTSARRTWTLGPKFD